jgi:hypothetical protein
MHKVFSFNVIRYIVLFVETPRKFITAIIRYVVQKLKKILIYARNKAEVSGA